MAFNSSHLYGADAVVESTQVLFMMNGEHNSDTVTSISRKENLLTPINLTLWGSANFDLFRPMNLSTTTEQKPYSGSLTLVSRHRHRLI